MAHLQCKCTLLEVSITNQKKSKKPDMVPSHAQWEGEILNRPAKHGVLLGSVAGSKCTGKNYTGRVRRCFWELVSVSKFCPSFYGHPMSHPPLVNLVESYQDFSHPSVTLVENYQDFSHPSVSHSFVSDQLKRAKSTSAHFDLQSPVLG